MNRSILVLSSLKENRNDNTSKSKSPQRVINGIRLFNFSNMQSYKHINKPYLNDIKKEHIKNKLDLQQITLKRLSNRVRKNELFVQYDHNPFSAHKNHSKSQNHIILESERNGQNLVDQINQLKKKKIVNREKEGKKLAQIKNMGSNASGLVQRQLKNTHADKLVFDGPRKNQSMITLRQKNPRLQSTEEQPIFLSEMDFDEIISLEQKRFTGKRVKQMNIFSIIFQPAERILNKTVQMLLKYFFSFNSIYEKFQRFKIPIYRDISLQSRKASTQKVKDQSLENQDTFVRNQLTFKDLVNVASGRFTPARVYEQLNADKNDKGTDSEYDENQIVYKNGQHNISSMYHKDNQELKQIEDYLRLTLSKKQQNYQKLNLKRVNDIDNKLSQIEKLVNLTIEDRKLHKRLRQMINNELISYTNENYRYPDNAIQKNKVVNDRKEKKNKNQFLKLEGLIKANQLCREHDRKVGQLIKKRV